MAKSKKKNLKRAIPSKGSNRSYKNKKDSLKSLISTPLPGWKKTDGIMAVTGKPPRFVSQGQSQKRIQIQFFTDDVDQSIHAKLWFGPDCEGPPGHAHGGAVAAVLDEAMGQVAWVVGHKVVAAKIEVNFRAPVPLKNLCFVHSEIVKSEGRKIFTSGKILSETGQLLAESTGLFITLNENQIQNFKMKFKQIRPLT